MPHLLSFTVDAHREKVRLAITGEIDLATVDHLDECLDTAARTNATVVELDMAGVTFLDSTGIHTLVRAHRALHEQRRRLIVTQVPAHVMLVMKMTGVDVLLGASPTVAARS